MTLIIFVIIMCIYMCVYMCTYITCLYYIDCGRGDQDDRSARHRTDA